MTKELAVSEKTSVQPAARPGTLSGRVTRRNTCSPVAPSVRAASSTAGSMRPSEAASGSTIVDRKKWTEPTMIAHSV